MDFRKSLAELDESKYNVGSEITLNELNSGSSFTKGKQV